MIAASAFPRLSPSGRRVVAGERVIVVDRTIDVGPGTGAQWMDDDELYYVRQPDGAFMRWNGARSVVVRALGFNTFSAAGVDHWAGADDLAPGPRVVFSNGAVIGGWSGPALSDDRSVWAALVQQTGAIATSHGRPARYADGNCRELRWSGRTLAWGVLLDGRWQIAGQLGIGHFSTPTLLNVEPEEFWPVPVLADGVFWLLTHSHDRLLLRQWGATHGYVVATGHTSYPDAKQLPDGRIRVVWDAGRDVLGERLIDPRSEPRVDLRPSTPVPPPPVDPPKEPNVSVRDVPNKVSVIEQCKRDFPTAWRNCHRADVSRAQAEEFARRAAYACWLVDRRFGLNGKRGDANTISQDCVCFKHDDGRESVIDFGGGAGGDNPTVQWSIVGHYLPPGPPLQLWIRPEPVDGGATNPGTPTPPVTPPPSTSLPLDALATPWDVEVDILTRFRAGIHPRDRVHELTDTGLVGSGTMTRGSLAFLIPAQLRVTVAWVQAHGNRAPRNEEWWQLAAPIADAAVADYLRAHPIP